MVFWELSKLNAFELDGELKNNQVILKSHTKSIALTMFTYIDKDRERLNEFLPWVKHTKSVADSESYIEFCAQNWIQKKRFDYGIYKSSTNEYVGNIGVHTVEWDNNSCELGYWILGEHEGSGLISESIKLLEAYLFKCGFNRIQIKCSDLNSKSSAVPKRCGYHFEGTLRQDCIENGAYRNTQVYSKLALD